MLNVLFVAKIEEMVDIKQIYISEYNLIGKNKLFCKMSDSAKRHYFTVKRSSILLNERTSRHNKYFTV